MNKREVSEALSPSKKQAERVVALLRKMGFSVSSAQGLEVVATVLGHRNWSTMREGLLASIDSSPGLMLVRASLSAVSPSGERAFLGLDTLFVFSEDEARQRLQRYWDDRLDATGCHQSLSVNILARDLREPSTEDLVKWLADASDADDGVLDELVHEFAMSRAAVRLNESAPEAEHETLLDGVDADVASINNQGIGHQLEYLKVATSSSDGGATPWHDFVALLRDRLDIESWPFKTAE